MMRSSISILEIADWWRCSISLISVSVQAAVLPKIINIWNDEGMKEPVITEEFDPDRTILRFYRLKKNKR